MLGTYSAVPEKQGKHYSILPSGASISCARPGLAAWEAWQLSQTWLLPCLLLKARVPRTWRVPARGSGGISETACALENFIWDDVFDRVCWLWLYGFVLSLHQRNLLFAGQVLGAHFRTFPPRRMAERGGGNVNYWPWHMGPDRCQDLGQQVFQTGIFYIRRVGRRVAMGPRILTWDKWSQSSFILGGPLTL